MPTKAQTFKNLYQQAIEDIFTNIPIFKETYQQKLYGSLFNNEGVLYLTGGNFEIRKVMVYEAMNGLEQIAGKISHCFIEDIFQMVNWIKDRMYRIPEVETEMIVSKKVLEETFKNGINVLIQRLARPLVDFLLHYPRSMNIRSTVLQENQLELMILNKCVKDTKYQPQG